MEDPEKTFKELRELFEDLEKSYQSERVGDTKRIHSGDSPSIVGENEHLAALIQKLDNLLTILSSDHEHHKKILTMKASLFYEQAKLMAATGDSNGAVEKLEKAVEVVSDHKDHNQVKFLYLRLINHLSYLTSKADNLQKSRELLESISDFKVNTDILVYSTEELFSGKELDQNQRRVKLNKLLANNLQMLGWVYGRLGLHEEHALKQHKALEKQLEAGDIDPIEWASRCTRLATVLIARRKWVPARYHLSGASTVLSRLERELIPHPELSRTQADMARGWVHYGLQLFNASTVYLTQKLAGNPTYSQEEPLDPNLIFCNLEFTVESVPATPIITTEQARLLFLHTHTWLKRARLYYTLRDFPLQYVNGVLDLSELYRYLAFYEPDLESMYNVQKRRADALETLSGILKEVRPQCYLAVNIELIRELAEVQIELLSINLKRLYVNQDKPQETEEIIKRKIDAVSDIHQRLGTVENFFHARPQVSERAAVERETSDNETMQGYETEEGETVSETKENVGESENVEESQGNKENDVKADPAAATTAEDGK